jgi:hypothetical protein
MNLSPEEGLFYGYKGVLGIGGVFGHNPGFRHFRGIGLV